MLAYQIDELSIKNQWGQIGLREVAIVVASLFGTSRPHLAGRCVPEHRLLLDSAARIENSALPLELDLQRALDAREGVHVLHFGFLAKLGLAASTRADVGVDAKASLLHADVADVQVLEDLLQRSQVASGLGC